LRIKTPRIKIINTWIGLSVLTIGVTIMLGSFLNVQNNKIIIVAVLAGALIFTGFLIKSFGSKDTRLDKGEQDNKGIAIA
jgi:uncharacterized membrane protein YqgA involved in biofilm formation